MANAKKELLNIVNESGENIVALAIGFYHWRTFGEVEYTILLKEEFSQFDYEEAMRSLDREYDDGYGSQELFGIVWLTGGKWLERNEYDGSECWNIQERPKYSNYFK